MVFLWFSYGFPIKPYKTTIFWPCVRPKQKNAHTIEKHCPHCFSGIPRTPSRNHQSEKTRHVLQRKCLSNAFQLLSIQNNEMAMKWDYIMASYWDNHQQSDYIIMVIIPIITGWCCFATSLKNMTSSVGMKLHSQYMGKLKKMFQTTNQCMNVLFNWENKPSCGVTTKLLQKLLSRCAPSLPWLRPNVETWWQQSSQQS